MPITADPQSAKDIRADLRKTFKELVLRAADGKPIDRAELVDAIALLNVDLAYFEDRVQTLRKRRLAAEKLDQAERKFSYPIAAAKKAGDTAQAERDTLVADFNAKLSEIDGRLGNARREESRLRDERDAVQKETSVVLLASAKVDQERITELNREHSKLLDRYNLMGFQKLRRKREYLAKRVELSKNRTVHPLGGENDQNRKRLLAELAEPKWKALAQEQDEITTRQAEISEEMQHLHDQKFVAENMEFLPN